MSPFTSPREKRLWIWAFLAFGAIYGSLFMGQPLAEQLRNQNVQAVIFVSGMVLASIAILIHGLHTKPGKLELSILIGVFAVYAMLFFRLGAPERSHLIEYSVLAIFLHKALQERAKSKKLGLPPALMAIVLGIAIGTLDEFIQVFLPNRVFDPVDIIFNCIAVTMAIAIGTILTWAKKHYSR